jgi:hypothetical protein
MLAVAALAPASVSAANPQPQDNACNNIGHGGRSPDYVWTTVGDAGVTAHWAIDANHFDAAHNDTVVVRVCVFDADGTDQGGIDQNTENDGVQLFSWSVLGYSENPCPDSELTFGSSVDSPAVETKKSDFIQCPDDDEPTTKPSTAPSSTPSSAPSTNPSTDPSTAPSTEPTTPASTAPSSAPSSEPTTAPSTEPTSAPTSAPSSAPSEAPSSEPTTAPSNSQSAPPTGGVEGVVGTPGVTLPPTDTIASGAPAQGSDAWRVILVLVAAGLAGLLASSRPHKARPRA